MPQTRHRKARKNPNHRQNSHRQNSHRQDPHDQAERPDMNGNDRETKNAILTSRQQGALPVLAASPTLAQAARDCRVSESTLRRWLRDPVFAEELDLLRQEYAGQVNQQCLGLILRGMNVLAESMEGPDRTLRLRAARYAMSFAVHLQESMQLNADIQEIRESLDSVLSGRYINHPQPDQPPPP